MKSIVSILCITYIVSNKPQIDDGIVLLILSFLLFLIILDTKTLLK